MGKGDKLLKKNEYFRVYIRTIEKRLAIERRPIIATKYGIEYAEKGWSNWANIYKTIFQGRTVYQIYWYEKGLNPKLDTKIINNAKEVNEILGEFVLEPEHLEKFEAYLVALRLMKAK
jgi:hypothetical protein